MSNTKKPQRLCSEIQLFDLCTKEKCARKKERYCTDEDMLNRFEAINQEEDFPADQYLVEESEDEGEWNEEYPGFEKSFDEDEEDDDEES